MIVTAILTDNICANAELFSIIDVTAELTQPIEVSASLSKVLTVNAELTGDLTVDAELVTTIRVSSQGYADYTGDYEVTSFCAAPLLTTSLVLPTNDKHMLDDVTVYSVPTSEEYNSAGGVTFTIGG